ncbi:MAG: WXG100 family type VII secretion target [Chloroflexota bacterium]
MSPQVHGEPEELRRFAAALRQYRQILEQSTYGMEGRARQLGETWHDQEYQKFLQNWETTRRAVDRFLSVCDEYVSHVLIKAQRLDDYLRSGKL